ncbi:prepilin peptidase [Subtercola sp. YIM 133946]|uniref:prepilin peptidase n=1 Tax=Subtercola sp. YIM 133946 TaxID=3118909 RepID=UPI002F93F600
MLFWLIPLLTIAAITIPLAAADLRERRLPNALLLVGYVSFALAAELTSLAAPSTTGASPVLVCCGVLAAAFGVWTMGGVGMGDVKLVGLLAGTLQLVPASNSPPPQLVAAIATLLLLVPAAFVALLHGRQSLALGPFLLAGFWLAVLV